MPKSAGVARAYIAYKTGKLIHFGTGLFRVTSFRAGGGAVEYDKEQIYILNLKKTKTKGKYYFLTTIEEEYKNMQAIFNNELGKV